MSTSLAKSTRTAPKPRKGSGQSRLSLWLKKLPDHNLAFNPKVAKSIKDEINDLESTSERLASLIQQDPALALSFYQYTKSKVDNKDGDIQSLVHMIGLIGLGHIEHSLKSEPEPLELAHGQKALYAASLYAAQLAKQLLPLKHGTIGERFFLPALFFNAPLWLMWQAAPKVVGTIHQAITQQRQPIATAFRSRLGFALPELLKRSDQFLALPEQTLQALKIDITENKPLWAKLICSSSENINSWLEKNKTAKHFFYSTEVGIYLVNHYALAIYFDHTGKQIKRFNKLLSQYLKLSKGELDILVNKSASTSKNPAIFGDQYSPKFLVKRLQDDESTTTNEEDEKETVTANLKTVHTDPLALLKLSKTKKDALQMANQSIIKICKASQCLILNYTTEPETTLNLIEQTGFDHIASFSIKNTDFGQFFKKILLKPVALFIKSEQVDSIKKQLPQSLLQFWSSRSFSILSVFHQNKPLAIIICDSDQWDNDHHLQFKRIGKTLIKTLKHCP